MTLLDTFVIIQIYTIYGGIFLDIIICEDDGIFRNTLEVLINKILIDHKLKSEIKLSTNSVKNVLDYVKSNNQKTLYFLDIDLNDSLTGFDIAKKIRKNDWLSTIVFITCYTEKSSLAYEYKLEAMDYIKKGLDNMESKIRECILLSESRQSKTQSECIFIETKYNKINIKFNDIFYFESSKSSHILSVYCANGQYEFYKSLKDVLLELDERFIKCHKSYIVNTDKIKELSLKDKTIILDDNIECPVSRTYYQKLKEKLQNERKDYDSDIYIKKKIKKNTSIK